LLLINFYDQTLVVGLSFLIVKFFFAYNKRQEFFTCNRTDRFSRKIVVSS
jgi:hypothetical protein